MAEKIIIKPIQEEMQESYIDYAMSVIMSRALPDVRDGLKPVHRRILYSMLRLSLQHNKPYKKCARVVGDCLGKYHPHGDLSVYDALVRMAQDFSLRYPLVEGQGNFGSIDGDPPAAQRYTETRLRKISEELLEDIDKKTVKFIPNFDESLKEPTVLPSKIPNLLLNGSSGIAVGMATNIPPHNMNNVCDAVIKLIDNPEIEDKILADTIVGPDFPTGGIICGKSGFTQAYLTGKGKVKLRAKTEFEKDRIVVTEIPYTVNKSSLIESIADLVKQKKIEGIRDLRDESDRKGMRIVIELKKNENQDVVLNQLFKHSQLQTTFGINMLSIVDGRPRILNLKAMISEFVKHRFRVVTRRLKFDLRKAEARAHIVEGLLVALKNIDEIVKLIKGSESVELAKESLIKKFELSEKQSLAILEMRLSKLTALETGKLNEEYKNLVDIIKKLKEILESKEKRYGIIKDELLEMKLKYGDERRTKIIEVEDDIDVEDLIAEEAVVVMITQTGYAKKLSLDEYKKQKRGGKGIIGTETKEKDVVENVFTTSNHNYVLFFTDLGRVYWLKAYKIPTASRYSRGKALVNLIKLNEGEKITAALPVNKFDDRLSIIMATEKGIIKKTPLKSFSRPRKGGIIAIGLRDDDKLVKTRLTPGTLNFILCTEQGMAVKFKGTDVREMGRNAYGVRGIKLAKGDKVVGLEVAKSDASLFTITENGYGKRTEMEEYRLIKRGGKGVRNIKTSSRNGLVVGVKTVMDGDELLITSARGIVIRVAAKGVSLIGRNTQGVRVMKLKKDDKVNCVARVIDRVNNHKEVKND